MFSGVEWDGKFFDLLNTRNFSKTAPSAPSRALRARKFENPAIEPPPLGPKSCNRNPPPQGVRDPIISSAWTPRRARKGSRASLAQIVISPHGIDQQVDSFFRKRVTEFQKKGVDQGSIWTVWPPKRALTKFKNSEKLAFLRRKTLIFHDFGEFLSKSDTNRQNLAKSKSDTTPSHPPPSNWSLVLTYAKSKSIWFFLIEDVLVTCTNT